MEFYSIQVILQPISVLCFLHYNNCLPPDSTSSAKQTAVIDIAPRAVTIPPDLKLHVSESGSIVTPTQLSSVQNNKYYTYTVSGLR